MSRLTSSLLILLLLTSEFSYLDNTTSSTIIPQISKRVVYEIDIELGKVQEREVVELKVEGYMGKVYVLDWNLGRGNPVIKRGKMRLLEKKELYDILTLFLWELEVKEREEVFEYEISGETPLIIKYEVLLNGKKPKFIEVMGTSFIEAEINDTVRCILTIINNVFLIKNGNTTLTPPLDMDIRTKVYRKYFSQISSDPEPNATDLMEEGEMLWKIYLKNNFTLSMTYRINRSTEWGTIPMEGITIRTQMDEELILKMLENQILGLKNMLSLFQELNSSITMLSEGFQQIEEALDGIAEGQRGLGNATSALADVLEDLTYLYSSIYEQMVYYEPQVTEAAENIGELDLEDVFNILNDTMTTALEGLEQGEEVIEEAKNQTLQLNQTLTEVYEELPPGSLKDSVYNAIQMVTAAYILLGYVEREIKPLEREIKNRQSMLEEYLKIATEYKRLSTMLLESFLQMVELLNGSIQTFIYLNKALENVSNAQYETASVLQEISNSIGNMTEMIETNFRKENFTNLSDTYEELSELYYLVGWFHSILNAPLQAVNETTFDGNFINELHLSYIEKNRSWELKEVKTLEEAWVYLLKVKSPSGMCILINGQNITDNQLNRYLIFKEDDEIIIPIFRKVNTGENLLQTWDRKNITFLCKEKPSAEILTGSGREGNEYLISGFIYQPSLAIAITIPEWEEEEIEEIEEIPALWLLTILVIIISTIFVVILYKKKRKRTKKGKI